PNFVRRNVGRLRKNSGRAASCFSFTRHCQSPTWPILAELSRRCYRSRPFGPHTILHLEPSTPGRHGRRYNPEFADARSALPPTSARLNRPANPENGEQLLKSEPVVGALNAKEPGRNKWRPIYIP